MATYTAEQLSGAGTPTEEISGTTTFLFSNPLSSSIYFTFETVRDELGFYTASSATNALGNFSSFSGIDSDTLVTSSYKWAVVIPPSGLTTLQWAPASTVAVSSSMLRGTGGLELTIS